MEKAHLTEKEIISVRELASNAADLMKSATKINNSKDKQWDKKIYEEDLWYVKYYCEEVLKIINNK